MNRQFKAGGGMCVQLPHSIRRSAELLVSQQTVIRITMSRTTIPKKSIVE